MDYRPVAFTEHDEEMLVKYMATTNSNLGKTGLHFYNFMVLNVRLSFSLFPPVSPFSPCLPLSSTIVELG